MSMFGQNRPMFLRTYGKQKRKVDQWFSPDLRKKAFSFSSTSSSEPSITEPVRNKVKASAGSRTSRLAKQRALKALKDLSSGEENVSPGTSTRRNKSSRPTRRTTVLRETSDINASQHSQSKKQMLVLSSGESEVDSFVKMDRCYPNIPFSSSPGTSISNRSKGRFVTHRKRVMRVQSEKPTFEQSFGAGKSMVNLSKDPVCVAPSLPDRVSKHRKHSIHKKVHLENSAAKPSVYLIHSICGQSVLGELSLKECEKRQMRFKRPRLCSTPSTVSSRNLPWYHEPPISDISFSCDEMDKPGKNLHVKLGNEGWLNGMQKIQAEECSDSAQQHTDTPEDSQEVKALEPRNCLKEQKTNEKSCKDDQTSIEFLTDQLHVDSPMERSRERCSSVSAEILPQHKDGFIMPSERSARRRQQTQVSCSQSLETELISSGNAASCLSKLSNSLTSSFCPSSSSSSSSSLSIPVLSASSPSVPSLSKLLTDRLKIECLSSVLSVRLERLDLGAQPESHKAQTISHQPLEANRGTSNGGFCHSPQLVDTETPCSKLGQSGSRWQTRGIVKRLSSSFLRPAISSSPIPPVPAPSKVQAPVVPRDRTASGTSRRACVSGLSASRWSKRGVQSKKQRNREATSTKLRDNSLNYLLPAGAEPYIGESTCGWLQGNGVIGLPATPLRLNVSSILANFTPDTLTTRTWGRLKAALSVHKKKTVSLRSPTSMNNSRDLFSTPMSSRSSLHLARSTMSSLSMSHYDEDISDAEKVYQECQQDGPLSFHDCIPPGQMKCCVKIGEGTFGEVFSTINNSNETVALKIIPIEGDQKVNGEAQKTFAEILHEIIISKELSMLDSKENNKTNGFICLNDLHCVRGCYPSALLKAWDKFDKQKGSENDRPDFFGNEQLFIVLEFEFGGSDLENMNGKLSSLAQAKSILHQVTASLAVAEQALCFEHRDLHWGNILVEQCKEKQNDFILNGTVCSVETRGVHVNIIDYSLSRLEIDGLTVSCDISNDEELFMGQGDYQFEIYRLMKKENNNCWVGYHPHSNVLWLHYLADKLLTMRYKSKSHSSHLKALQSSLKSFHSEILNYKSATDALLHCSLFQS